MNIECYNAIIAEMQVLLDGQKFVKDGEIFKNENKAVKVFYNEDRKTVNLAVADVSEEGIGDFATVNSWLFGDDQGPKDATSVGVDFADTLRGELGIKKASRSVANNIALPTSEKGDSITLTTLTQKLLAIYPQYKDTYKEEVAKYGKFLFIDFYTRYFIPEIKALIAGGEANRKQLKKVFDMLDEIYVQGDSAATDAVVMVIATAIYGDDKAIETANNQMGENTHMKISVKEMLAQIKSNKKLAAALIK